LWEIHVVARLLDLLNGVQTPLGAKSNEEPLTFMVTATGEIAASLRALAFVANRPIETIALDTLYGIHNRATDPAELLEDSCNIIESSESVSRMVDRFKKYRDANGLDYPDALVDVDVAEMQGMITDDEACRRRLEIIAGAKQ
jgi:hypothetical protein